MSVDKNQETGLAKANPEGTVEPMLIRVNAVRFPLFVLLTCFGIELTIYYLDYLVNYSRLASDSSVRNIFSTTIEDGIASWFSQTQTMIVALTLWFLVVVHRTKRSSWWTIAGWIILAAFFTYMSMDDGAKIHERVGSAMRRAQDKKGNEIKEWFPSYSWQVFILPFFAVMGLYTLSFLWIQMREIRARLLVVLAIAMFVTAVGIDFIEGLDKDHDWNLYRIIAEKFDLDDYSREHFKKNGYTAVQHFFKSAEECIFEMGANSILLFLFLRHIIQHTGTLTLEFFRKQRRV